MTTRDAATADFRICSTQQHIQPSTQRFTACHSQPATAETQAKAVAWQEGRHITNVWQVLGKRQVQGSVRG